MVGICKNIPHEDSYISLRLYTTEFLFSKKDFVRHEWLET